MMKKAITLLLSLAVVMCMCIPIYAEGSTSDDGIIPMLVNSTEETDTSTNTVFSDYSGEDHFIAYATFQKEGVLEISSYDCENCQIYTDKKCTDKVSTVYDSRFKSYFCHVYPGTYYAYVTLKSPDNFVDYKPEIDVKFGIKLENEYDLNSTAYDAKTYYGLGISNPVYFKFIPPKTGVYSFDGGNWALCDSDKTAVSVSSFGGSCAMVKDKVYWFKSDNDAMLVWSIPKPVFNGTGTKAATSFKKAKKLKAVDITKTAGIGFTPAFQCGKPLSKWMKIKTSKTTSWQASILEESLKGKVSAGIYSESGKRLASISPAHAYKSKNISLKKGTYYIKITKASGQVTGLGGLDLFWNR